MSEKTEAYPRINLTVPIEMSIMIEKESDKRGINRTQFIREAIHEKINRNSSDSNNKEIEEIKKELLELKETLKEVKSIMLLMAK